MKPDSPKTTYIQPWNNQEDRSVLYTPQVKPGDMMIVPQFLMHYSEPNKINFKKRILSFDFLNRTCIVLMDLIILNDGLYQLIPVTKQMLEGIELISEINCFDLCDILRLKLTGYVDTLNLHIIE